MNQLETMTRPADEPAKVQLLNLVNRVVDRYGLVSRGRARTRAVLALLGEGACERSTEYRLSHQGYADGTRFDPMYGSKSELATSLIISSILDRLKSAGYTTGVAAEAKDVVGSYDITILRGSPTLILKGGEAVVRVEVKASLGLPLSQISRYLLSPAPLVLVRTQLNQVAVLRPQHLEEFVRFMSGLLASKATRILDGVPFIVPGPHCKSCPDASCPYFEPGPQRSPRLVAMADGAFEEDLDRFYRNLPGVCERTATLVLDEVKSSFAGVQT